MNPVYRGYGLGAIFGGFILTVLHPVSLGLAVVWCVFTGLAGVVVSLVYWSEYENE